MTHRHNTPTDDTTHLLEALLLTSSGREDEAEKILTAVGEQNLSAAGLDLMARLAVKNGEVVRARKLWGLALQRDPTYQPANAALVQFERPWIAVGLMKRLVQLTGIACVLLLSITGVRSLRSNPKDSCELMPPKTSAVSFSVPQLSDVSVSNCIVQTYGSEIAIIFREGIFRTRCILRESALGDIEAVAEAIIGMDDSVLVIIEGHIQPGFTPPKDDYANSYEFAQERAALVADIMVEQFGVSRKRVLVASAGSDNPPFPGDDKLSAARNRTVVIRLVSEYSLRTPIL